MLGHRGQRMSFIITLGSWDAREGREGGSWGTPPAALFHAGGTWLSVPLCALPGSHTAVPTLPRTLSPNPVGWTPASGVQLGTFGWSWGAPFIQMGGTEEPGSEAS